jgi:hypothetical protein
MEEVCRRMERAHLGGKTFLEEEVEALKVKAKVADTSNPNRSEKCTDILGLPKSGRFGHLHEVGWAGFVCAVEREDRGVWVVVHLYESVRPFCGFGFGDESDSGCGGSFLGVVIGSVFRA